MKRDVWSLILVIVLTLLISLVQLPHSKGETVPTNLSVQNTPPTLVTLIPNVTLGLNQNATNLFDLDDYFTDNEDIITFSVVSLPDVTIIINQTTHEVSFYPGLDFTGVVVTNFTANDGTVSTTSNQVYITVSLDSIPPRWFTPSQSKQTIFQNDFVNFTTTWTDNVQLGKFIFAINEGGGWSNRTQVLMSGSSNISLEKVQISASASTVVFWRFIGFDAAGNTNQTDIYNFTVATRTTPPVTNPPSSGSGSTGSGSGSGAGGAYAAGGFAGASENERSGRDILNFTVEPETFKISLKQGETVTRFLKIRSLRKDALGIRFSSLGVEKFVRFEKENITIAGGDSQVVGFDVTADRLTAPDHYNGYLVVESDGEAQTIPILIEVKAIDISFDIDVIVDSRFKKVKPGESVEANVTLTNLADLEKRDVIIYNAIKEFEGKVIDSVQETRDLEQKILLRVNLTVPLDAKRGEYIWYARAVSENEIAIDSDTFLVGDQFSVASFIQNNLLLIILLILMVLAAVLATRYYNNKERVRVLNLYVMLEELKALIKENKLDDALALYLRIKSAYGEPVAQTALHNKEFLREEMKKLVEKLKEQKPSIQLPVQTPPTESKEEKKEDKVEEKKEEEKPKEKSKEETKKEEPKEDKKEIEPIVEEKKTPEKEKSKEEKKEPDKKEEKKEDKLVEDKKELDKKEETKQEPKEDKKEETKAPEKKENKIEEKKESTKKPKEKPKSDAKKKK